MIIDIAKKIEEIGHLAKSSTDIQKINGAIQATINLVVKSKQGISNGQLEVLNQLESELGTWQSKLEVILKEPVGRQGMTKHAQHWAQRLKK